MEILELAKLLGGLSPTVILAAVVILLWRKLETREAKFESLIERYHVLVQELTTVLTQVNEELEKE